MKRQPTEWETIFANDVTNKGLISMQTGHTVQQQQHQINNPIKKWAEDFNLTVLQRRHNR